MQRHQLQIFAILLLVTVQATGQDEFAYPKFGKNEILIFHQGHTASYNPATMMPNWVAYELRGTDTEGDAQRAKKFSPDPSPLLEGYELAEHWHYTNSGWVRGHMAPAGDFKYSQSAMDDTFYTTNICPMDMTFNNGIWKRLEEKIRGLASEHERVYIVTGPVIGTNKNGKVGDSNIVVPDAFFKAILVPYRESYVAIGFLMNNEPAPKGSKLRDYAVTVNDLEALTKFKFFSALDLFTAVNIKNKLPLKELGLY